MGVEREVARRETDVKTRERERKERDEGESETTEEDIEQGLEMSDRGRENKKRHIGIRREGKKISYGWCRWETRGIEVGRSKVVLCICQFKSVILRMYNLLM